MSRATIQLQRHLSASGPLVLRRADGAVPEGFLAWGPHWAAAFPTDLKSADLSETPLGIAIGKSEEKDEARGVISGFWDEAVKALLPVADPAIPVSGEGLSAGAGLVTPVSDGSGLAAQIERHLAAQAGRRATAGDAAAFADLLLRQISVLRLPSDATVTLERQHGDDWLLALREAGALGCLAADRLEWVTPDKKDKSGKLECRPDLARVTNDTQTLYALARAVQLAQLAIGSGLDKDGRLRVEVCHAGLGGRKLMLAITAEDRGLALARLARQVARDLGGNKLSQPLERLPCRPALSVDREGPSLLVAAPVTGAEELQWHGEDGALPRRWVYSGDRATSSRYGQRLPFALVPGPAEDGFGALSAGERGAYLDWLSGARRAPGAQPGFVRLYLQGLEYRILADGAGAGETARLAGEILALRPLTEGDGLLAAQLDSLLDWLGATGRCPQGGLSIEGPLTRLVSYGRRVAQGHPLRTEDLELLGKIISAAELGHPPVPGIAEPSDGEILPPPQKPLAAAYRSISGLCDQPRQIFPFDDARPLPDLRNSMRLRAILAARQGARQDAVEVEL